MAAGKPYSGSSSTALACGESARTTMDLNCSSCSRGTARFSIFNSTENRLRKASRWSMASAAMTPRESETASSLFRLPVDSLTPILRSGGDGDRRCRIHNSIYSTALVHHFDEDKGPQIWAAYPLCSTKKGAKPEAAPSFPNNLFGVIQLESNPPPHRALDQKVSRRAS